MALEQPVRTTDQTLLSAAGNSENDWGGPVSVQANVGVEGRVYGITFIGGAQSPAVKRWINNLLYRRNLLRQPGSANRSTHHYFVVCQRSELIQAIRAQPTVPSGLAVTR